MRRGRRSVCWNCVAPKQRFVFVGVDEAPLLSLGRHFSAPAIFKTDLDREGRAVLMGRDHDEFNRWEAGQALAADLMLEMARAAQSGAPPKTDPIYLNAIGDVLARAEEDHAFAAQMLMPPPESELAPAMTPADPDGHPRRPRGPDARHRVADRTRLARLNELYAALETRRLSSRTRAPRGGGPCAMRCCAISRRTMRAAAGLAEAHYRSASNMTDMIAGLAALTRMKSPCAMTPSPISMTASAAIRWCWTNG